MSDIAHFVKGSLITSCPITKSQWVTLHILWKVSSHLFLWPIGSKWHCTRQSHPIFSYDHRLWVVTLHILWKSVSSHPFLWPTACEWHCTFCERQSPHLFLWPTACEWYIGFFSLSYYWQPELFSMLRAGNQRNFAIKTVPLFFFYLGITQLISDATT